MQDGVNEWSFKCAQGGTSAGGRLCSNGQASHVVTHMATANRQGANDSIVFHQCAQGLDSLGCELVPPLENPIRVACGDLDPEVAAPQLAYELILCQE